MPSLNIIISNQLSKVAAETTMDLQGLVSSMKDSGMTDKAIKDMLMNDLTSGGRVFGNFRNQVKNTVKSGVGISASNSSRASFESAGVKEYRWVAVGDKNVCPDCERRNGDIGDMEFWKTVGLPQSGFSICRYNCRCQLLPSDYAGEDLTEPILKSQPDLDIPANLSELGAAIKVNKTTLENYSDIISNIVTDPRYSKADKIKMLKSAFLGNKSLSKLGTTSRELIYRYTNKQYKPSNFKAKSVGDAREKNRSVNLTGDEKEAVNWYTANGYKYINEKLRKGTKWADMALSRSRFPTYESFKRALQSALDKSVTWDATSWRGIRFTSLDKSNDFMSEWGNYKDGDFWMPKAVTSSSGLRATAKNWAKYSDSKVYDKKVLLTVEGKNGSYIDTFSSNAGEYEVLFMPNTRFKIIKSEIRYKLSLSDDIKTINLEEFGELYKSLDNSKRRSLEYAMAVTIRETR